MIALLSGKVIAHDTSSVIIDVNGVGYRVMLSTSNLSSIGAQGSELSVRTTMIVREDSITLFGFFSETEQLLFEKLILVSGIGPKVALSALSSFSAEELHRYILSEDVTRLSTIPGVGKKTAQRIILELRGALDSSGAKASESTPVVAASIQASEALLGMGFTATEVSLALKGYEGDTKDVAALIRFALMKLGAS